MKIESSLRLNPNCLSCKFVRRKKKLRIICKLNPRHKRRQG
ncbi:MAG TPA: 50S ribosomal protein L36 [Mycoplasmatales bacterium]|nr:50S ribosomal protein L36 [Mycoplasmatales bacterium]